MFPAPSNVHRDRNYHYVFCLVYVPTRQLCERPGSNLFQSDSPGVPRLPDAFGTARPNFSQTNLLIATIMEHDQAGSGRARFLPYSIKNKGRLPLEGRCGVSRRGPISIPQTQVQDLRMLS